MKISTNQLMYQLYRKDIDQYVLSARKIAKKPFIFGPNQRKKLIVGKTFKNISDETICLN